MKSDIQGIKTAEGPLENQSLYRIFHLHFNLLGFAFHLSWMYLFLFMGEPWGLASLGGETFAGETASYDASMLFLVITMGIFALFPRRAASVAWRRPLRIAAPWLTAGGTLLLYGVAFFMPNALGPLNILSGMATGIGSALLAIRWVQCFGLVGTQGVMGTTLSLITATAALCVTMLYLPLPVVVVSMGLFPLLSGFLSTAAFNHLSWTISPRPSIPPHPRTARRSYRLMALGSALLGLTVGLLVSLAHEPLSTEYMTAYSVVPIAVMIVSTVVYILDKQREGFFIEFVGPMIALSCLAILATRLHPADFLTAFHPIGTVCLEVLFLIVLIIWADRFSLSMVKTFSICRMAYAIANYLATIVGKNSPFAASVEPLIQASSFALFAGVEVVIAAGVLLVALARKKPLVLAPSPEDAGGHEDDGTPAATAPRFRAKLDRFATEHRLTARETDVAEQLIKGRGYARIAVELSIAEGTVYYHTRNVYAKTSVHTREDLIDLFDNFTFNDTAV